jgi:hypothetical protein
MATIERHANGGWIAVTEYALRRLDAHGDAYDVDHFDTLDDALAAFVASLRYDAEPAAVVVSRVDWTLATRADARAFRKPMPKGFDPYNPTTPYPDAERVSATVCKAGNAAALAAGGWNEAAQGEGEATADEAARGAAAEAQVAAEAHAE